MSNQQDMKEIELSIEHAKANIARKDAFQSLIKNKDFKFIIEEGYFNEESTRLVMLRADYTQQSEEAQKNINDQITAVGCLHQYFLAINKMGTIAEQALSADESTRTELLEEGL